MFENAKPSHPRLDGVATGLTAEERARLRALGSPGEHKRFALHLPERAGDALRAVEWSDITARLNAVRDLRLLLWTETHAPIEGLAASFGDAAASYFALLEDGEQGVNLDALGQSKSLDAMDADYEANRSDIATGLPSDALTGDTSDL